MISIRMLKLCDKSICKPLNIIFKSCLTQGILPSEWKKQMSQQFKKNNKQCIKNSRPVSLFPICSKISERFISRYSHFLQKATQYLKTNQDLRLVILLSIRYQPLLMKCFPALMTITKLDQYSLTFKNLSMKCGTMELFLNLNVTESQEICQVF